jgi:hypothetical protein
MSGVTPAHFVFGELPPQISLFISTSNVVENMTTVGDALASPHIDAFFRKNPFRRLVSWRIEQKCL